LWLDEHLLAPVPHRHIADPKGPTIALVGDLNRDGLSDVVIAGTGSWDSEIASYAIFLNQGGWAGSAFAAEQTVNLAVLDVGDGDKLPVRFALGASTPNPFSRSMSLGFDLPRAERVRLEVFDLTGRRVHTLVSEFVAAGRHQSGWEGADERGQRLPAGIYLIRMKAGSFEATRRTVLMP